MPVGELISFSDRLDSRDHEIAMYRMAWRGQVQIDIADTELSAETEVALC